MALANIVDRWNVPGYNYFFEIGALVFLFILLIKYFYHKRFPTILTKVFLAALIVAMLDIAVDITASVLVENYITTCPEWINMFFNGAFYVLQVALPCLMFIYLLVILGPKFYKNKLLYLFLIPGAIFTIMILFNPLTHWVFYFGESNGTLMYLHGPLFLCYYGTAIFYFLLVGVFAGIFYKKLAKRQLIAIYISIAAVLIGIGIQIAFPQQLLTGITIAMALYFIEDNISNPDDLVDRITGVFNFNALMLYLEKTTKESRENFIVSIDVKGIEEINETLGIVTGNELYGEIGDFFNSLQKNIYAFRVFSSKFVLLFKTKNDAENAIGAIKHRFEKPWEVKNVEVLLTCKLVEFTDDGKNETCNQFLNYTNLLAESLENKKGEILYVNSSHIEKISRELKIQKILSESLNGDCKGFSMRYQPIYNNKTGKFDNAEALLRFTCDEFGNIPPAEFVPLAEKAGLANLLDEFVTRTVCAFVCKHPEIKMMEINVSGAEFFTNPAKKFVDLIKETKVDTSKICFEITETATIKHSDHIYEFMTELGKAGVRFAIDDFGTGYSNVTQLLNQPFNIVKLDKTLLEDNEKARLFVKSMRDLFKSLNYPIVIEGVETKEQYEFAKKLDFEYIQGYYFAKCLTEDEYLKFLEEHK